MKKKTQKITKIQKRKLKTAGQIKEMRTKALQPAKNQLLLMMETIFQMKPNMILTKIVLLVASLITQEVTQALLRLIVGLQLIQMMNIFQKLKT